MNDRLDDNTNSGSMLKHRTTRAILADIAEQQALAWRAEQDKLDNPARWKEHRKRQRRHESRARYMTKWLVANRPDALPELRETALTMEDSTLHLAALAGWTIRSAHKRVDHYGYPLIELQLVGPGGTRSVRFVTFGYNVTDIRVR